MRITDTKNGMVYLRNIAISLSSEFDAFGWAVLADKDNHSSLSFIKDLFFSFSNNKSVFLCAKTGMRSGSRNEP